MILSRKKDTVKMQPEQSYRKLDQDYVLGHVLSDVGSTTLLGRIRNYLSRKLGFKSKNDGYVEMQVFFTHQLIDCFFPKYPILKQWEIKRKYGKNPAIVIDVWELQEPCLCDLIPKVKNNYDEE